MTSIRDRAAMYQAAAEETARFGDTDAPPPPKEFMPTRDDALHVDLSESPADGENELQMSAVARAALRYQVLVDNLRKDQDRPGLMQQLKRTRGETYSEKKQNQKMHTARLRPSADPANEHEMSKDIVDVEPEIVDAVERNAGDDALSAEYIVGACSPEGVEQMDALNSDCDFDSDAVQVDEEVQLPEDTVKPLLRIGPVLSAYSTYSSVLSSRETSLSFSSPSQKTLESGADHLNAGTSCAYTPAQLPLPELVNALEAQSPQAPPSATLAAGSRGAGSSAEPLPCGVDEASFSSITSSTRRQSTHESVAGGADDDAARRRWRNERSSKLPKAKVVIARRKEDADDSSDSSDVAAPPPTTRRLIKEYKDPAELLEGRVSLIDLVCDEDGSVRRRNKVAFDEFGEVDTFNGGIDLGEDEVEIDPDMQYAGKASKQKYRRRIFGAGAQGGQDRHAMAVGADREEREKRRQMQFARRSSLVSGAIDRVSMAADPFIDFMSSHNPAPVPKARGPFSKLWKKLFRRPKNRKPDVLKGS